MLYRSNKIYVDDSNIHGRGVFASEFIKSGELLEECHFIELDKDREHQEILHQHFFAWPKGIEEKLVICLGYGSIFNTSAKSPNADWQTDTKKNKLIFFAIKDIQPGQEIFTNYNKSD
jgi:SET domain-containing protein